jgi:HEPN domain-containing protein
MNRKELQTISRLRVKEAKTLLDNGYPAGAYYLLGYAVECALKACIAKQTQRHDFPDRNKVNQSYTHDLEKLLTLAGLRDDFNDDARSDPILRNNWEIVENWSEQFRYEASVRMLDASSFYSACTSRRNGVLSWLKKRW